MTTISIQQDRSALSVTASNGQSDSLSWHRADPCSNPDFMWMDEAGRFHGIISECTVTSDGLHILLVDGRLIHFYFRCSAKDIAALATALRELYENSDGVLEVHL